MFTAVGGRRVYGWKKENPVCPAAPLIMHRLENKYVESSPMFPNYLNLACIFFTRVVHTAIKDIVGNGE